jgi:hypothetical protein
MMISPAPFSTVPKVDMESKSGEGIWQTQFVTGDWDDLGQLQNTVSNKFQALTFVEAISARTILVVLRFSLDEIVDS